MSRSGSDVLRVVNVAAKTVESGWPTISSTVANPHSPCWSPDGRFLSGTRKQGVNPGTWWIIDVEEQEDVSSEWELPTVSSTGARGMAWSPDGKYLTLVQAGANTQIVVLDVATREELFRFTVTGTFGSSPSFAGNGSIVSQAVAG
jgi:Tol biopolymer transport system component